MKKLYLAQIVLLSIALSTINLEAKTLEQSTKKLINDLNTALNPFQISLELSEKEKNELRKKALKAAAADQANIITAALTGENVTAIQSGDAQDIATNGLFNKLINSLRSNDSTGPVISAYNPKLPPTNEIQSLKDRILVLETQALKDENIALKNEIELLKKKSE